LAGSRKRPSRPNVQDGEEAWLNAASQELSQ